MIDANMIIEKQEGKTFPPLPANVYQVELLDVNAEVKTTYDTRNKPEEEQEKETIFNFQFTLLSGKDINQPEDKQNLRGRNVWINFVPTYLYIGKNGKNKLYRIVEGLLQRNLTLKEEAEGITGALINGLIGKQIRLGIEPVTKGDKTYDQVTAYYVVESNMEPLTAEEKDNATVKKDTEDILAVGTQDNEDIDNF